MGRPHPLFNRRLSAPFGVTLLTGWRLSGIYRFSSGSPLDVTNGTDQALNGVAVGSSHSVARQRPNGEPVQQHIWTDPDRASSTNHAIRAEMCILTSTDT